MATTAPTEEQAPVYSKAVLEMIGALAPFSTPSIVIAGMQNNVAGDWQKRWPQGCKMTAPVELRGVCLKVVGNIGHDPTSVKLELAAAENTVAPATVIFDENTLVLTLDGAGVKPDKFQGMQGLASGTKLYAKRLIVFWQFKPTGQGSYELAWKVVIAKLISLDQFSKIEDWTNLP